MYLIFIESESKIVYDSFCTVCKTLNQSWEDFYYCEKAMFYLHKC